MKKIALDPGHFGGALSKHENRHFEFPSYPPLKEGDLNLKVALRLSKLLIACEIDALLTRDSFESFEISENFEFNSFRESDYQRRIKLINNYNPDLVLSIHFNSNCYSDNMFETRKNGVMTFISNKKYENTARLMASYLSKGFKLGFCEKNWFPKEVQSLWTDIGFGVNIRDLRILNGVKVEAVLVEGPIINNLSVYKNLCMSNEIIDRYAFALFEGIKDFFSLH